MDKKYKNLILAQIFSALLIVSLFFTIFVILASNNYLEIENQMLKEKNNELKNQVVFKDDSSLDGTDILLSRDDVGFYYVSDIEKDAFEIFYGDSIAESVTIQVHSDSVVVWRNLNGVVETKIYLLEEKE